MGDVDLTIGHIVRYGTEMHTSSEVVICTGDGARRATFPKAIHVAEAGLPGWWTTEQWTFIDELPKTSTLKFDKRALRARHEHGGLAAEIISGTPGRTEEIAQ